MQWPDAAEAKTYFDSMLVVDRMSLYLDGAFIVAALLTLLFAPPYLREQGFEFGEFYALVLFAAAGMVMVAHATHLVSLLIGIETMSLAAYVLTGCWRKSLRSSEGAMKYFLMGAFATGFLVYGIALVYGTTGGELSYAGIAAKVNSAAGADVLPGRVLHPGRAGVQGRGGAVPHVGARRVRGRAHAGHRLHGGGREGGRVRRDHAHPGHRVREPGAGLRRHRLGEHPGGGRGDHDDAREPGRGPPGERQAHARVLVDRRTPGYLLLGVVAVGPGRRQREAGGALLPGHLHLHDARRVRRGRLDRQPQGRAAVRRRLGGRRRRSSRASRWR